MVTVVVRSQNCGAPSPTHGRWRTCSVASLYARFVWIGIHANHDLSFLWQRKWIIYSFLQDNSEMHVTHFFQTFLCSLVPILNFPAHFSFFDRYAPFLGNPQTATSIWWQGGASGDETYRYVAAALSFWSDTRFCCYRQDRCEWSDDDLRIIMSNQV